MFTLPAGLGPLLTVDIFRPYVGADFTADTVPKPVRITLARIVDLRTPSWMERQGFSLIFSSSLDVYLLDGLYQLKAPDGAGPWPVDLFQVMSPPTHRMYQGMFN